MTDILDQSAQSKPAPTRVQQFDVSGFVTWLAEAGAEIGIPGNQYEVVRYRAYPHGGGKLVTHIVYQKESGQLTYCGQSREHYVMFRSGLAFTEQPRTNPAAFMVTYPTRAAKEKAYPAGWEKPETAKARQRVALVERDGTDCWFCGKPMPLNDMTLEHLVPKSNGGRNTLANYALAHAHCNRAAADKPLVQKIAMRLRMRAAK